VEIGFRVLPLRFLVNIPIEPYMIRPELASFVQTLFIGPDDTVPDRKDAIVAKAPEDQGTVLFRMFINDRNEIARLQEYQRGITSALLKQRRKACERLRKACPHYQRP
jgi:hypothetical protein